MINTYLIIIVIAFLFRALFYERRFAYLNYVYKLFWQYHNILVKQNKSGTSVSKDKEIQGKLYRELLARQEITKLYITEAGMINPKINKVSPLGLGFVDTSPYSVLDNIAYNDKGIADIFNQCIQRSIGYYKHLRNESLNPLLWPEYIILKLPKAAISKIIEIVKSSFMK